MGLGEGALASSTGSGGGDFFFFGLIFSTGDEKGETSSLGFERTTLRERPSGSSDFVEDEAVSEGTPPPRASTVRTDPGACCRFDDEDEGGGGDVVVLSSPPKWLGDDARWKEARPCSNLTSEWSSSTRRATASNSTKTRSVLCKAPFATFRTPSNSTRRSRSKSRISFASFSTANV